MLFNSYIQIFLLVFKATFFINFHPNRCKKEEKNGVDSRSRCVCNFANHPNQPFYVSGGNSPQKRIFNTFKSVLAIPYKPKR